MSIRTTVLVSIMAGLPIFVPALLHRSAAYDIVFHGGIAVTGFILVGVLGCVFWVRRKLAGISDPVAKKAASSRMLMKGMPAVALVGFAILAIWQIQSARELIAIQRHGQRAMADVTDIYEANCGKHGCNIDVAYRFVPTGAAQAVTGYAFIAGSHDLHAPRLVYAQDNHRVPIAYEVADPANSALNFDEEVFTTDHMHRHLMIIATLGIAGLIGVGVMWLLMWNALRTQLRAAPAVPVRRRTIG